MRPVRTVLTVAALAVGLLMTSGSVAVAQPVVAVETQVPGADPNPGVPSPPPSAGGSSQVGSVSEIAQGLTGEEQPSAAVTHTTVGPYASPAAKSAAIWESRGRPNRLIIVRRGGIDTVANGQLQQHIVRYVGNITLGSIAAYVPSSWLSINGPTARLSATLVLSTGVTLDASAPVASLVLTGGAAAPAAASVFTGGGVILLRGVHVTSADPVTGAPMPNGPGRPYLSVSGSGRLDAADAVVSDLGATVGPKIYPGLEFNAGSTGSVVRTSLQRNTVGLRLDQSNGVRLENVTVSQAVADGLVLTGDTGTVMLNVEADGNGADGVAVSGKSTPRPISGITTHGNHNFGLVVVGQAKPQISAIVTTGDGVGGIEINHSTDVAVTGFTATDEPMGIYTHVSSARVALAHLNITGGRRGVVVEKTTAEFTLAGSRVDGAELGVSLGGHQMTLTDVTVVDTQTAAVIERGAANVTVERLTINGGKDGFIANPGTTGVVVRDLATEGVSNTAVRALSPGEQILGGRIDGSVTGIDVQAPTTVSEVEIAGADTGLRARTSMNVDARQVDIAAASVGINVADGTPFVLSDSRVHALESVRGSVVEKGRNDLTLPPLPVLGAVGVPLVLLAALLEVFALIRQRHWRRKNMGLSGLGELSVPQVRSDAATAAR